MARRWPSAILRGLMYFGRMLPFIGGLYGFASRHHHRVPRVVIGVLGPVGGTGNVNPPPPQ
jgi:hypothetical protein